MEKPSTASNYDETMPYRSVFIDTDLDTHLATMVSSTDTVSDLKQKIMHEHPLCFPQFGEIKIHSLKVKKRGFYYHLSDSMLVKSAFRGVNKSWFISVDASTAKQHDDNQHCLNMYSNNVVACMGINSTGYSHGVKLLLDAHPEQLSNDMDKPWDQKSIVADHLDLDVTGGEFLKELEIGIEHTGDDKGKAKSADIDNRPDPHTQEKGERCDNENEKTPTGGRESSPKAGIDDVQDSLLPESVLETGSHTKKKRKSRKRSKLAIPDLALVETNASLSQPGENEPQRETIVISQDKVTENENIPRMVSYSDANKVTDSVMPSATVLSEGTGMLEKPDERQNDKSRKTGIEVQCFRSVEDTSQSKPAAKKKRKFQEEKKRDKDLLKDDQTLISDSNKKMLETATISEHSLVGKLKNIDSVLDASSADTPEVVHLRSVNPTNEKGKKKKKSSNTLNQEIAPVPSSGEIVGEENCGDPKELDEEFDVELVHGKHVQGVISSEAGVVSLKEKPGNLLQEVNIRASSEEFDISNREASNVEGRHRETVDPSKSSKKRKKSKRAKDIVSVGEKNCGDPKDLGEAFDAELVHGKHMQGVINSDPGVISMKEKHVKFFPEANMRPSSQEFDISNREANNVEGGHCETVNIKKSSKRRKKSKKTKDLVSGALSTSPTEPNKTANGDNFDNIGNKRETKIPSNDRKEASEKDTISTSFLAMDKEIDDVIQNAVESVQRIRKGEVDSENMNAKSRKKTSENQCLNAKNFTESKKDNVNVGDEPAPSADNVEEVGKTTKQAKLTNADSIIQLNGFNLEGEKDIRVENDPLSTRPSQVKPHGEESKREGKCLGAVVNVYPSESGDANEATNYKEVSCESNRINFNHYFVPSQHSHEIVGSAEVLLDRATETKILDGKMKARKNKKKHYAQSRGPLPDLQCSQRLKDNHGVGAKPQADNSNTIEVQSSFPNSKSEKITSQPNKEPLNASDSLVKALPSSMPDKFNNFHEEARSLAVKPSGTSAHAKCKRAASNSSLESNKTTSFLTRRVKGCQSREDDNPMNSKKTSTTNGGEVVDNSHHKKSLIGVSGSIFNDDSNEASSNEADNSDASTRTPSDDSFSSDYSDGESNADFNLSQNGRHSWKGKEGGGKVFSKPFSSGMSLDAILRSSSRYKKAKLTASQSQLEDIESQPLDLAPEGQTNP
ncbi:uncharacterized protein LOC110630386 [Manihot esculenta]|uniref:Uncharacterized protein n=1 Tax=Manihot esculenta TaxID=3983 RepID=A0A2C9UNB1_MANES|nr:uncharacterized protein LOC110630386 [Manihot esculenta]OAY32456.1 hypothetical protein MANES_13G019100v8 [Manihot esculenta]